MTDTKTPVFVTIDLDDPIIRGDKTFDSLTIRKPGPGEMRGLSLVRLGQFEVDELYKLLPRIATVEGSPITKDEAMLGVADLMEVADKVSDFLMTKRRRASLPTT